MSHPFRAVLDTNVLVSAIVFGGVPERVVDAARENVISGVVSLHILNELRTVLTRPRFGVHPELVDALAEEISRFCEVVAVEHASGSWGPDPGDDPVVEAALRAGAGMIVTGDAHLLGLKISGVRVLTPSELLADLGR